MDVARKEIQWRPVDGNTGNAAARIFYAREDNNTYIAVFNYLGSSSTLNIPAARIGLGAGSHNTQELFGNTNGSFSDVFAVTLPGSDAALYRIYGGVMDSGNELLQNKTSFLYPNPANDHLAIHFAEAVTGEANFAIHDLSGKEIWSAKLNIEGNQSPDIATNNLAKGFYIATVTAQGKAPQSFKFIKN
jgi:alpha-galactosidase